MGTLTQGILGPINKKVGNVVGGTWKGINYVRGYVIPADPQSAGQLAQRSKFAGTMSLAQSLLSTVITSFWNAFAVGMSGFNKFMSENLLVCETAGLVNTDSVMAKGSLEDAALSAATYATGDGNVVINWSSVISGNGLATDYINCLIIDSTNNEIVFYSAGDQQRADGEIDDNGLTGYTATDLICYLWTSRGTGASFTVSNSDSIEMTAP